MATVILVRHGRSTANVAGILTGRAAGVDLDDVGQSQAARAAARLAAVPLVAVVSSPLVRCRQTARIIAAHQAARRRSAWRPGIARVRLRPVAGSAAAGARAGAAVVGGADPAVRGRVPGRRVDGGHAGPVGRGDPPARRGAGGRARRRRGVGGGHARRHHQVRPRGRPRHAPRPVPAHHRQPRLGLDRPVRHAPPRGRGHQHGLRRPVLAARRGTRSATRRSVAEPGPKRPPTVRS